ncbi:MAG: TRAP transporter large permease subunit [Bacteroidetes bacterium]|nr:MAG: TRAP transporter large permease subunit [Bacteroidota bacterium]
MTAAESPVLRGLDRLSGGLSALSAWAGRSVAWLTTALVLLICYDVLMRYLFSYTKVWMQEVEWHFFALVFLLGAAYTLKEDRHVRVDVFFARMGETWQARINLLGTLLFLVPFCAIVLKTSWAYALESWRIGEASPEPGGLPARYLIKGSITLGYVLLGLQALSELIQALRRLRRREALIFLGLAVAGSLALAWLLSGQAPLPPREPLVAILLFGLIFVLILAGYPVAFTLGGVATLFGLIFLGPGVFNFLPSRFMGTMTNLILMAVPLFVYMGIMLEKSGLAEQMLETMALLFGKYRGGLAYAVILVGAMLAASTGIVGATVITMGLISLPTMLKRGYRPELATGTIAASGTLGQIIPPSVVLVLLGSVLNVSVGDLFKAAIVPGLLLVGCYLLYVRGVTWLRPQWAPAMPPEEVAAFRAQAGKDMARRLLVAFLLPLGLIVAVLGSIFAGIASPTEAAAVGALGATLLTFFAAKDRKGNRLSILKEVMQQTTQITSMVFMILMGATVFALVFRLMGGDRYLVDLIEGANLSPTAFLLLVMAVVFVAGFFIDFIEIIFIIVPVVAPLFVAMDIDLVWIGILLALNLQTSFLSPPFGFSLFYLKGVAPPEVKTQHLYRGIVPFLIIQVVFLVLAVLFPGLVTGLVG